MNNITWTDSDAGRTFWKFNEDTGEWAKTSFWTWEELKACNTFLPEGKKSSVYPPEGG